VKILSNIHSVDDLRALQPDQLPKLAEEIRAFLIEGVSRHGGHLAPSLGSVDLTLSLHYIFNTPEDKIVWDVGHQAYTHKILTGRRERFDSLRQYKGISGFPRVGESEFDTLSVGHASTSISAGLGMAHARDLKKEKYKVVSIIGDGSLSGGLAFEGLNNLGTCSTDMIVVLNDNEMSISKNVGALSRYLTRVITDKNFNRIKSDIWGLLGHFSNVGKGIRSIVRNVDDTLKHLVIPGKFFEDMGLRYLGPVNGHDIKEMNEVFKFCRDNTSGPVLVHVQTKKGKGYSFAEDNATKFHGVGSFSPETGETKKSNSDIPTYSEVFGDTIVDLAQKDSTIVAITAAMPDGTKLTKFKQAFPERFFDVGIAEGHAVTFAAGLALSGYKPVVALYSTFLQRAYDHIIHDIALDNLNVIFAIDRAGLVGDDGPTHHGAFDISFLRTIPNVTILAPRDENELRNMLYTALVHLKGPVFIRYPRGAGRGCGFDKKYVPMQNNKPYLVKKGADCAFLTAGHMFNLAEKVSRKLDETGVKCALYDARYLKPLNEEAYVEIFKQYRHVVTFEANTVAGGYGSSILEIIHNANLEVIPAVLRVGYPDAFVTHGKIDLLHKEIGLDTESVAQRVQDFLQQEQGNLISHISPEGLEGIL